MNTLANCLSRITLRCLTAHNKSVVACLSQSITDNVSIRKRKSINKAMRAYIERVKEFEQKSIVESAQYDTGKRFLANIMGEDPASFNNDDVDRAVEYLLPSGIYQKWCRPEMKPPQEVVQQAKFDETGRPYHFLFYTAAPNMYELQYETVKRMNKANKLLEQVHRKGHIPEKENQVDLLGSEWVDKPELGKIIHESVRPQHFSQIMESLERLAQHPMSDHFKDFLMTYRKPVVLQLTQMEFPEVQEDSEGRFFVETTSRRKTSEATVKVLTSGEGKIVINKEHNLQYFTDFQAREQILYPLQFTGMLGKVDLDITVAGGGFSGQSGAIRFATAMCLAALVGEEQRAQMQMAGLLSRDRRNRERKKFGRKGARRGYTWLKR